MCGPLLRVTVKSFIVKLRLVENLCVVTRNILGIIPDASRSQALMNKLIAKNVAIPFRTIGESAIRIEIRKF